MTSLTPILPILVLLALAGCNTVSTPGSIARMQAVFQETLEGYSLVYCGSDAEFHHFAMVEGLMHALVTDRVIDEMSIPRELMNIEDEERKLDECTEGRWLIAERKYGTGWRLMEKEMGLADLIYEDEALRLYLPSRRVIGPYHAKDFVDAVLSLAESPKTVAERLGLDNSEAVAAAQLLIYRGSDKKYHHFAWALPSITEKTLTLLVKRSSMKLGEYETDLKEDRIAGRRVLLALPGHEASVGVQVYEDKRCRIFLSSEIYEL